MERLRKCKSFFGEKANVRLTILMILPFIVSFFETFGISAMASFITLILDEESLNSSIWLRKLYELFDFSNYTEFVRFSAVVLILFYLLKTIILVSATQIQTVIVMHASRETGTKVLQTITRKPYEYFTKINVAEIIRTANDDVTRSVDYIIMVLDTFKESLVAFFILMYLFITNTKMTAFIVSFLAVCMILLRVTTKRKIAVLGKENQTLTKEKIKWLNQSVYGIKDIKIGQTEEFFSDQYDDANRKATKKQIRYNFWANSPAYVIEMMVMVCVLLYIIIAINNGVPYNSLIPMMTAFALAAVRLLPACNRIVSYLTRITYRKYSVDVLYDILHGELDDMSNKNNQEITMDTGIEFADVTFAYDGTDKNILEHVNVKIHAGMAVGIMGPSGAGKTTFVDLLLGLLKPQEGRILCDGVDIREGYSSYLEKISYIPQNIFLTDDTICNNVAFGVPQEEISRERVWKAIEEAQLEEYVKSLPDGLDTMVGERGIRLSGGQRQRIGIARALYTNPSLLVLDEATSALDNDTEAAIMESVNHLKGKKTMIIIAHRLSTIRECDAVYQVKDGCIAPTELDEEE